jgi:hypothetical protein
MNVTRRGIFKITVAVVAAHAWWPRFRSAATAEELTVPDSVPTDKVDFAANGIES